MRRHVYFYTYVDQAYEVLAACLSGTPGQWLPFPARASNDARREWLVDLDAEGALPPELATRPALVTVEDATTLPDGLIRGIRWRSDERDPLFPFLDADLELVALNGSGCQFSLIGSYRPPLSASSGADERSLGHRVAEACVRRFVLDVSERVRSGTLSV